MRTRTKTIHKQFSIKFDDDMRNKIIEIASKENISQAELVRQAVEEYLKNYTQNKFKKEIQNTIDNVLGEM